MIDAAVIDEFIKRAERQMREFDERQQRMAKEEADFRLQLQLDRLRVEAWNQNLMFFAAAAMNPRIDSEHLAQLATVLFRLPRSTGVASVGQRP